MPSHAREVRRRNDDGSGRSGRDEAWMEAGCAVGWAGGGGGDADGSFGEFERGLEGVGFGWWLFTVYPLY